MLSPKALRIWLGCSAALLPGTIMPVVLNYTSAETTGTISWITA